MEAVEAILERESLDYVETDLGFHAWNTAYFVSSDEMPAFAALLERLLLGCVDDDARLKLVAFKVDDAEAYASSCERLFAAAKLRLAQRRFEQQLLALDAWLACERQRVIV